ncbi:N-alpha-acetyltransferase 35, NatC auxiliary subunit, partial [Phenoliferia sp. Uapishka_3]
MSQSFDIQSSLPVFRDARPLLEAALAQLGPGELVKVDDMQLVQIMSAVEIMEDRTDSFLAKKLALAARDPSLPAFDATLELLPDELVWILDRILCLEMAHLDGHPLVSTLFTCRYLRPAALTELSLVPAGADPTSDPARLPGLRRIVLRAMLLGVLKCTETVWEECCKSQVYDHEDIHLSTAGLTFPELLDSTLPANDPSPLHVFPTEPPLGREESIIGVNQVLEALDEAQNWLVENLEDTKSRAALLDRIAIRMETVYTTALLASPPQTSPDQLLVHFSRIRPAIVTLSVPSTFVPSPSLKAVFAEGFDPPLQTSQPFRAIPPITVKEAWNRWSDALAEMENVAELWGSWRRGLGWGGIKEYFVSLGRREALPYPRSILQSVTFSHRTLFATDEPIALVSSFFHTLAGVPPETWITLNQIRTTEKTWNSPARKVLGWADRVVGLLVASLTTACQNRGRGIYHFTLSVPSDATFQLIEISPLMTSLLPTTPSIALLSAAITSVNLSQLLEVLLSGFDLSLYTREDWIGAWWVGQRLAGRLEDTWAKLRGEGRMYVDARWLEARVIRAMCLASIHAFSLNPPSPAKGLSPLLSYDEPESMERARFEKRFEWLDGSSGSSDQLEPLASWSDFDAYRRTLAAAPTAQIVRNATQAYGNAVEYLTALASIPIAMRSNYVRPEHHVRTNVYGEVVNGTDVQGNERHLGPRLHAGLQHVKERRAQAREDLRQRGTIIDEDGIAHDSEYVQFRTATPVHMHSHHQSSSAYPNDDISASSSSSSSSSSSTSETSAFPSSPYTYQSTHRTTTSSRYAAPLGSTASAIPNYLQSKPPHRTSMADSYSTLSVPRAPSPRRTSGEYDRPKKASSSKPGKSRDYRYESGGASSGGGFTTSSYQPPAPAFNRPMAMGDNSTPLRLPKKPKAGSAGSKSLTDSLATLSVQDTGTGSGYNQYASLRPPQLDGTALEAGVHGMKRNWDGFKREFDWLSESKMDNELTHFTGSSFGSEVEVKFGA